MKFAFRAPSVDELRARLGKSFEWVVLLVISCGGISTVLTSTNFTVAIPAVMQRFGIGNDIVQLAMSAYTAAMTIAMLPAAWLFDRFGMRRCFLFAMGVTALVSAIGAYSPSFGFMVIIRIAQGVAAGLMMPMGIVAIMRLFPPGLQGRAWGIVGFVTVLAPSVAPAMSGFLVDVYGWESVFWLNVPFCIASFISAIFLLPYVPPRAKHGPDWLGLGLLGIASAALIVVATLLHSSGPLSWQVLSGAGLCLLAIVGFLLHAKRINNPIVAPRIFKHPQITAGAMISVAYGVGIYGSTYLVPLFLQSVLGYSAGDAGIALMPAGIMLAAALLLGGYWVDHHSPRLITILGLILFGASYLALWAFSGSIGYRAVVVATVVSRIGTGIMLPALCLGSVRGHEPGLIGQATVFMQYLRQVGGMLGVAGIAVFVEWRSQQLAPAPDAVLTAFSEGFLIMAIISAMAALAARNMCADASKQS